MDTQTDRHTHTRTGKFILSIHSIGQTNKGLKCYGVKGLTVKVKGLKLRVKK